MSSQNTIQNGEQADEGWQQIREKVLKRDGYECQFCGKTDEEHRQETDRGLDVHHIIPQSDGGEDRMRNLAALCRSCHGTMENLHGQAMGEMVHEKDYRADLENIVRVFDETKNRWKEAESSMCEFVENHPTFREEFRFITAVRGVESHELDSPLRDRGYPHSEWEAIALYGYIFGVGDTWNRIERSLEFDFDEFRGETDE